MVGDGGQWECRRCGSSGGDFLLVTASLGARGRQCSACSWVTVDPMDPEAASLRLPDTDWEDSDDTAIVLASLARRRRQVVDVIRREVRRTPRAALTWLTTTVGDLDRLDKEFLDVGYGVQALLAVQQVYLALLELGPLPLFVEPVGRAPAFWRQPVWERALECIALSRYLREARLGTPVRIRRGVLVMDETDDARWAREMSANMTMTTRSAECSKLYRDDPMVNDTERRIFDYSVIDALGALLDPRCLGPRTRVVQAGELVIIDLGPGTSAVLRRIAADFTLTLERMRRHAVPAFFYAAGAGADRTAEDAVVQATEMDWLTYAPLLSGAHSHHVPAVLTSRYLLFRAMTTAASSVSFRLHNAVRVARRGGSRDPDEVTAITALARKFHTEFEQSVGAELSRAGMTVSCGLESLRGRPLPCGEIDAVGGGVGVGGLPIVVVCEAKNSDLTFHKDLGIRQARELMGKAHGQATRKATWVRTHWSDIAPLLGLPAAAEPAVAAVVVTRLAALPTGRRTAAFLALHELVGLAQDLLARPADDWRPDIRAAVLPGRQG